MFPKKLKKNDEIRVVTPARSLSTPWITKELQKIAKNRFKELGFNLTFGKYVNEIDEFDSSSIEHRVEDLHDAFKDKNVKMIITVIGGFNSNQILKYLNYNLIKNNPKIICGFSDITALCNAIYAKTGIVTYSGPHFFNFGEEKNFEYTLDYFKKCLISNESFKVEPAKFWSNDRWSRNQNNRNILKNEGYWILNEGKANGKLVGGNLCTLQLLHGTEYMPDIKNSILFIEEDNEGTIVSVDRDLQSLIHQKNFNKVKGIVFGRFEKETKMTKEILTKIVKSKKELDNIPIIANVDFGHTTPLITFPIGGKVSLKVNTQVELKIIEH
ncbi:MAG: S66 peptidase family protein [Candidatus Woesearchaeota archaeon]